MCIRDRVKAGFNIECITSLSTDYYAGKIREYNLKQHFGNNIGKVICLEQGGDKDDILKNSQMTSEGELTPRFKYLSDYIL